MRSYLEAVTVLIAGILTALVGVLGVGTGTWLQGRDSRRRWLQDQKLYNLCDGQAVNKAEELIKAIRKSEPTADHSGENAAISLLKDPVRALRHELDTGDGQFHPALREPATSVDPGAPTATRSG